MWIGFIWIKIRADGGFCGHGNVPSVCIEGGEDLFLGERII